MSSSEVAAWASAWAAIGQAVFSVVAILAATWIAGNQDRAAAKIRAEQADAERRRAHLEARDNAIVIASGLETWNSGFVGMRAAFEGSDIQAKWAILQRIADKQISIGLPTSLVRLIGNLRVLGQAADDVQRAVVQAEILKSAEQRIADHVAHFQQHGLLNDGLRDADFATVRAFATAADAAAEAVLRLRDS